MAKQKTINWKDDQGEEFTIRYHYEGSYYPAKYPEPAEYPELVIDEMVDSNGRDIVAIPDEAYEFIENQ